MKRLLPVLMLVYIFMPVTAQGTAYVYKFKETYSGMRAGEQAQWGKYRETWKGYAVVEVNDRNTANIWRIYIWKVDGVNEYDLQDMMTCGFLQVIAGKNTVWIVTYEDDWHSFIFSGIVKPAKIADPRPYIASSFRGRMLLSDEADIYIGISSCKISMTLDSRLTPYAYTHTGQETVDYVMNYLEQP